MALAPVVNSLIRPDGAASPANRLLAADVAEMPATDPVTAFYNARGDRLVWSDAAGLRPEATSIATMIALAGDDGLDPGAYGTKRLADLIAAARGGDAAALARADIALTSAIARYGADLHRPAPGATLAFTDPAVAMRATDERDVLALMSRAPTPAAALTAATAVNPIYAALRSELVRLKAANADSGALALIQINLERARALPIDLGRRYILVNPAAQKLWLYEEGLATDEMPVVVGKVNNPTPSMIGLVRYVDLAPYWNVPPDLVRNSIAPKALAGGPDYLAAHHFEALSGWSEDAALVPPESIDWTAVEAGTQAVHIRQLPGPDNMMGLIKFMLPNPLGIYLHDTPLKSLFSNQVRADSSGCVRLFNAAELARRLFGRDLVADPNRGPEQRVDLAQPVPVYILYLTAQPTAGGGVAILHDLYGRDAALLAALGRPTP